MSIESLEAMIDLYILGILWSIGNPIEDRYPYLMLRHRERYFLNVVRKALNVSMLLRLLRFKTQHPLEPEREYFRKRKIFDGVAARSAC